MAATPGPIAPEIHETAVLAPGATIIGRVTIEAGCYIGPNAVLRGDIEPIIVREGANIQDNCTVHTELGHPVEIGRNVSVGHGAVVHGATLGEDVLVGMNAVVLNGAVVGAGALIGALTLVPEGFTVPPSSLVVGTPCRIVRESEKIAAVTKANSRRYHGYRDGHAEGRWAIVRGPGSS